MDRLPLPIFFKGLFTRQHRPEKMDDPSLDASLHFQALEGLARINQWSRSANTVWAAIQTLACETNERLLRVLDIATGAGDIPVMLWKKARRAGIFLEIDGCDKSPQAIQHAQRRAQQSGAQVHFYEHNVMDGKIPLGYDILISSLFLHHLSNEEALEFLQRMAWAARKMILVNDLVRCVPGLMLAYLGSRVLSRSPVVHTDSVLSVRSAFNLEEIRSLVQQAGLMEAQVESHWPSRFLLTWEKTKNEY